MDLEVLLCVTHKWYPPQLNSREKSLSSHVDLSSATASKTCATTSALVGPGKTTRPVVMGERTKKIIPSPETMVIHMGISWLWEYPWLIIWWFVVNTMGYMIMSLIFNDIWYNGSPNCLHIFGTIEWGCLILIGDAINDKTMIKMKKNNSTTSEVAFKKLMASNS